MKKEAKSLSSLNSTRSPFTTQLTFQYEATPTSTTGKTI